MTCWAPRVRDDENEEEDDDRGPGWLVANLDRLIPPELASEPESQLRSRILVGSCFGLALLGLATVVVRVATVPFDIAPVVTTVLCAFVGALPWVQRRSRSHKVAGGALVAAMLVTFSLLHVIFGVFPGPSLVVFPLIPLLGAFFVDVRFGVISAGLAASLAVALGVVLPPPTTAQSAVLSWTFMSVGAVVPIMCALVAAAYEQARARRQRQLLAATKKSEEAFARAEAASRGKTEFLRHVSHELRTPLNAIIGYTEMVEEQLEERGDAEALGDVRRIRRASELLLALIGDILDLSRVEAGAVDLEVVDVDLVELVEQVRETAQPLADASDDVLVVSAPGDLPRIRTDPRRLRQVLLNLVSNACKFTVRGKITISVAVYGEQVVLRVRDTGVGMSADQRARLFEPFVQVDLSAERRQQGSGLGLALSRRLVEVLGGRIEDSSVFGSGSEFTVRLPLRGSAPTAH